MAGEGSAAPSAIGGTLFRAVRLESRPCRTRSCHPAAGRDSPPGRLSGPCPCQPGHAAVDRATCRGRQVGRRTARRRGRRARSTRRPDRAVQRLRARLDRERRRRVGRALAARPPRRARRRRRAAGRRSGPGPGPPRRRAPRSAAAAARSRTRLRRKAGSALAGSSQTGSPAAGSRRPRLARAGARAAAGAAVRSRAGIPASERLPLPRASRSSTVSAWSSRVWPSSSAAAPSRARRRTAPRGARSRAAPSCRGAGARQDLGRVRGRVRRPGGHRVGPLAGARGPAVVDGQQPGAQPGPRRLEGERRGQRRRVRAAGGGDQHQSGRVPSGEVGEVAADRERTAATAGRRTGHRGRLGDGRQRRAQAAERRAGRRPIAPWSSRAPGASRPSGRRSRPGSAGSPARSRRG